jgi:hypothetical protein
MILVDTSVWIDHLRQGEPRLAALVRSDQVLTHPFVIGELACGNLRNRNDILAFLRDLPAALEAAHDEALQLIDSRFLHGKGLGWVDVHLLASALLTKVPLWTKDRNLAAAARTLSILDRL